MQKGFNEVVAMDSKWNVGKLLSVSSGYWRGCTLQTGVRMEIFTLLDDRNMVLTDICVAIQSDGRGTELLLNALAGMRLLIKEGNTYRNTPFALEWLSKKSEKYMGHIILHHHHILDGWAQLDQAVKTGAPVSKRSYGEEIERESFLMGMFNIAMNIAPDVASQVNLAGRKRLLDLGGGPGTYAIHFCLANPDLQAVIFDRPTTKPFAMETVESFELQQRIDFAAGDFNTDPIAKGPYDVAWLSHILHSNRPETCQNIITKTIGVLEPGGLLLIHDFILDTNRDAPEYAALFALNMLINNQGRTYSENEIQTMLEKGGAKMVERHPFQGPNASSILVATI